MAEIKCPMCGKANDDSLDVCEFCDARLKPLIASDGGGAQQPYWSDSSDEPVDDSSTPDTGDEEIVDEADEEIVDDGEAEIDDDAIEWLRDLSSDFDEDQPDMEEPAPVFASDDDDDGDPDEEDDPDKTRKLSDAEAEGKISDWLKDKLDAAEAPVKGFDEDRDGSEFISSDSETVGLGEGEDAPEWLAEIESGDVSSTDELIAAFINENGELAVEADVPDWLASMREDSPDTGDEPADIEDADVEAEEDSLDWLATMREEDAPVAEEQEPDEDATAEPAEVPEWLAAMQEEKPESGDALSATIEEDKEVEEAPLDTVDAPQEVDDVSDKEPEFDEIEPAAPVETLDWLAALQEEEPEADDEIAEIAEEKIEVEDEALDLPEAVQDADVAPEADQVEPAVQVETPDWLAELQEDEPEDETVEVREERIEEQEEPLDLIEAVQDSEDILEDEPEAVEIEAVEPEEEPETDHETVEILEEGIEAEEDILDLPADVEDADDVPFEVQIEDEETAEPADIPEWPPTIPEDEEFPELVLTKDKVETDIPLEEDEIPDVDESVPVSEDEDLEFEDETAIDDVDVEEEEVSELDWLAEMKEGSPELEDDLIIEDEDIETEEELPAVEARVPEWLLRLQKSEEEIADEVVAAVEDDVDEVLDAEEAPEWLGQADEDIPEDIEYLEPEERPGWLQDLDDITEKQVPLDIDRGDLEEVIEETGEIEPADQPDWLQDLETMPAAAAAIGAAADTGDEFDVSDVDVGPEAEAELEPEQEAEPVDVDDTSEEELFPDWLSDEDLSDLVETPQEVPEAKDVELPSWMAERRPDEDIPVAKPVVEGPVEGTGPLRGLRSVLSSGDDAAEVSKAPSYSARLEVADHQQVNAKILQQMIATESDPVQLPEKKSPTALYVLRSMIGTLMVVVVSLAIIFGRDYLPPAIPELIPQEVVDTNQLVNSINPGDPVLLSFDFSPGSSPEMTAASAPVIDHLMIQNARLSLVSTNPAGPALAEYSINNILGNHGYRMGEHYINLGYIPGETSGLQAFNRLPQWVLPISFNGPKSWETLPLAGITRLSDFMMVIVITDQPDAARAWIEQVGPYLDGTPMVFVTSAQTAPLIRPYYAGASTQVSGLVNSLPGAAAYEQMLGRQNLSTLYWDGFTAAVLVGIAAIIIGGVLNAISEYLNSRKRTNSSGRENA